MFFKCQESHKLYQLSVSHVESGSTQLTILFCQRSRLRECSKPPPTSCLRCLSSGSVPSDSVSFSFLQVPIFISSSSLSGLADAAHCGWVQHPSLLGPGHFSAYQADFPLPACTSLTLPPWRSSHLSNWNQLESPWPTPLPVRWTVLKWRLTVSPAVESSLLLRKHLRECSSGDRFPYPCFCCLWVWSMAVLFPSSQRTWTGDWWGWLAVASDTTVSVNFIFLWNFSTLMQVFSDNFQIPNWLLEFLFMAYF